MPVAPQMYRSPGHRSKQQRGAEHDWRRRKDKPWRSWYSLVAWARARRRQLTRQPYCERHLMRGELVVADTVNHRIPHRGQWDLFIDPGNHESVCKTCHDSEIQREERAAELGRGIKSL